MASAVMPKSALPSHLLNCNSHTPNGGSLLRTFGWRNGARKTLRLQYILWIVADIPSIWLYLRTQNLPTTNHKCQTARTKRRRPWSMCHLLVYLLEIEIKGWDLYTDIFVRTGCHMDKERKRRLKPRSRIQFWIAGAYGAVITRPRNAMVVQIAFDSSHWVQPRRSPNP